MSFCASVLLTKPSAFYLLLRGRWEINQANSSHINPQHFGWKNKIFTALLCILTYFLINCDILFIQMRKNSYEHIKQPRLTLIKYHKWGDLTEFYFSQFWRLVSPRSRCPKSTFHSGTSSFGLQMTAFFPCVLT